MGRVCGVGGRVLWAPGRGGGTGTGRTSASLGYMWAQGGLASAQVMLAALPAAVIAGGAWVAGLTTVNVAMQMRSPDNILGRCLSIYQAITFGGRPDRAVPPQGCRPGEDPVPCRPRRAHRVFNYRSFQEIFDREFERFRRHGRNMSLMMLDVDNFKRINDTFGHQAGDHALREVSRILMANLRKTDYAFRYGGDEFVVLMAETDAECAAVFAPRIRASVKRDVRAFPDS